VNSMPPLRLGLLAAAIVAVLDQASKYWIVEIVMQPPRLIPVTPFFNLVLGRNCGVSFGFLRLDCAVSAWVLSGLALAIVVALVIWLRQAEGPWIAGALGLVIGGAIGNVFDRIFQGGGVVDFLDFYVGTFHWPAFNVADTAITVGAAILILESLFVRPEKE
jgi:signal peptidase II